MKSVYLIIAIAVIALLVALFFITFIISKKMPKPKGCEDIEISDEHCMNCSNFDCNIRRRAEIDKIKEELKEENDK